MEAVSTKIFVTVGSRRYPFDRLFKKLDELFESGIIKGELFAQIGTSTYLPKYFKYKDFLTPGQFIDEINKADIVVSHGASGSIMKALYADKKVIAVTRLEKYGEHINDHQIQNNEAFGSNNYVIPVIDMDQLGNAFTSIENNTANLKPFINKNPMAIINMVDDFIQETWEK